MGPATIVAQGLACRGGCSQFDDGLVSKIRANEHTMSYYKFLGCDVIYREACYLTATCPHKIDVGFLPKGLHDLETRNMVEQLQAAVDEISASDKAYEAILLGYARCNDGLVGVQARDIPLILPRAHDCIKFYFGSRQAYREYFDNHPGTYFETTGWMERGNLEDGSRPAYSQEGVMAKLGLTDSYEEMVEKYGKDNADYIMSTLGDWRENYSRLLYLQMGPANEDRFIEQCRQTATKRTWEFEVQEGNWTLLEKLFYGKWDEDFLVVPPGKRIAACNDEAIVKLQD